MSTEQNIILARRFWEEMVPKRDLTILDEIMAADYIQHQADVPPTRAGLKQFLSMQFTAFPDVQATIENIISEGDMVVTRTIVEATHTGPLGNLAATGKQIHIEIIDIWRVADGQLAEHWGLDDNLGMLQQLGVIPL